MLLAEVRDGVAKVAKEMKEHAARKRPMDIPHIVEAWRGEAPVASALLYGGRNMHIVLALQMAVAGFDADITSFVMESLTNGPNASPDIHPITGKPIESGDFNELAATGGIEQGYVSECLYISAQNRAGDVAATRLTYHYVGGKYLVWDEPWHSPEGLVATGAMADPIQASMLDVTFSQVLPGLADTDVSRAELDAAVARVMGRTLLGGGCQAEVMLWAEAEGDRARVLRGLARRRPR